MKITETVNSALEVLGRQYEVLVYEHHRRKQMAGVRWIMQFEDAKQKLLAARLDERKLLIEHALQTLTKLKNNLKND